MSLTKSSFKILALREDKVID